MNAYSQPAGLLDDQIVSPCTVADVFDFVRLNHYSRTCPKFGIATHCFAVRIEDMLVGAAVFGHQAGNAETGSIFKPPYNTKDDCRELKRFVMIDDLPRNSESRFIGESLRWLRRNTDLNGVVSYADPEQDHSGTIYRVSNWEYTGLSNPSKRLIVDGEEIHRRRATNLYGDCKVSTIEAMGHIVGSRVTKPKHRYVYVLNKALMPFLKYKIIPFVALLLLVTLGSTASVRHSMQATMTSALHGAKRELRAIAKWFRSKREAGA